MTTFCPFCFEDGSLRQRLKELRPEFPKTLKCDFHPTRSGIPAKEVAALVDGVFREHFAVGNVIPSYDREDDRPEWQQQGQSLVELIEELTSPEQFEIAESLTEQLIEDDDVDPRDGEEPFYADDQLYEPYDLTWNPNNEVWAEFKEEITHHRRFFSDLAQRRLAELFKDLHFQSDAAQQPVIYELSPSDEVRLYRVRRIDDPEARKEALDSPAEHLGVPPPRKRTAGRMNAAGVGAFYASFDLKTCIAEVRPPVGCVIVGAAFELLRPIVVLDTTRFAEPIRNRSIFNPVFQERLMQWRFMKKFMSEISRPVLPDDVVIDYIPTQAVSEFITTQMRVPKGKKKVGIDGIIFASAQRPNGGRNIVLLGDATLIEGVEPKEVPNSYEVQGLDWTDSFTEWKAKFAPPTLKFYAKSGVVRKVTGVDFEDSYHSEYDWDDEF